MRGFPMKSPAIHCDDRERALLHHKKEMKKGIRCWRKQITELRKL